MTVHHMMGMIDEIDETKQLFVKILVFFSQNKKH